MTSSTLQLDIAIIGGGIAGLWLLNRLCNQGYNAVLFEQHTLGGRQTIASQGMIHGGIKYALGGALTGASEAIATMPDHWRRCLRGEGDVDLRRAKVLSEHFYLWSTQSLTSRLGSFLASKLTRGRVDKVAKGDYPDVFNNPHFSGNLYRLVDLVLDVPSVVSTLADNCAGRVFSIDWQQSVFQQADDGSIKKLQLGESVAIEAKRYVLAAGEGNQALCDQLGIRQPAMQRRPLKQVLVKHRYPHALYAHCMGANPSPRLTVSSHRCEDGGNVWYLGGDLATAAPDQNDDQLIARAQSELADLFPWLDFSDSAWAVLAIDRAEPKQAGLVKPDKAFAAVAGQCANAIVAWPTKLTLAPNMADEVIALLDIEKSANAKALTTLRDWPTPAIGTPCWETLFD